MAISKIADLRDLTDEDLQEQILEAKRELFDLRFKKATRQLENKPHLFKHIRHRLAQLMTVERERQLAAVAQQVESDSQGSDLAPADSDTEPSSDT